MSKSNYFSSKSVFGQLISLIDDKIIKDAVKKSDSDRYVKRFKTKDHLISIFFGHLLSVIHYEKYLEQCLDYLAKRKVFS
ncbi:DUF4372 domain-containing protein [Flavobacterium sp. W22_SRS_FP1]|uniref:DUF4372 domain-containing protein n=1 Tax=Flavobacterium sp. W22_SRS_FP1 TaxID=3240276 RepID=UPI003F8EFA44